MKITSWLLASIPAGIAIGAIVGASTNTTPLGDTPPTLAKALDTVPRHEMSNPRIEDARRGTQDRYALETAEGRVEIAELHTYGLGRNRGQDVETLFRPEEPIMTEAEFVEFSDEPYPEPETASTHAANAQHRSAREPVQIAANTAPPPQVVAVHTGAEPHAEEYVIGRDTRPASDADMARIAEVRMVNPMTGE